MSSKQTPGNLFLVFCLCIFGGFLPIFMFIVRVIITDFDDTLEYFCSFVDGCFNE